MAYKLDVIMIIKEQVIFGNKFIDLDNGYNIFYRDIHEANNFFVNCNKEIPFVLVSHNSDGKVTNKPTRFNVGSSNDANIMYIPSNLVHWYSQNICVNFKGLESIPIGLENDVWFPKINKIDKIINKLQEIKNYQNLMYICFNINNNIQQREEPYRLFSNQFWCTVENGINGNNEYFNKYLDRIYNHKFVLCPEGNGTDTHRTWETLYVGSIPIEKRNINNSFYEGKLPICFVDEWSEINEKFLNNEYNRISNTDYNLDLLTIDYWKNKIKTTLI